MHFGVDSVRSANTTLGAVVSVLKKPEFWGRYLTGFAFTPSEARFLGAAGIRLLPVYQATTAHPHSLQTTAQGQSDAHAAMSAATGLGVPKNTGIALYADIERGYNVQSPWLAAWVETVQSGGFVPGVYCASDDAPLVGAYGALSHADRTVLLVWTNSPCVFDSGVLSTAKIPTTMGGAPIRAGGGVHTPNVWQYAIPGGTNPNQPVDLDVCDDAAFAAMWSP